MKLSLKTILRIIMLIFILIPALIITSVGVASARSFSDSMLREEAAVMAYSEAAGLSTIFEEYTEDITDIALNRSVILSAKGQYAEVKDELDSLLAARIATDSTIIDIAVTDTSGCIVKDCKGSQQGVVFFDYNDDMQSIGKTDCYISDIYPDRLDYGTSVFVVAHLVRSEESTVGFVAYVISLDRINAFLSDTAFLRDGQLIVTDGNATTLNLNGNTLFRAEDIPDAAVGNKIKSVASSGAIITSKREVLDIGGYFSNYGNVAHSGWYWIGLYPASNASAAVSGSINVGLLIMLVILAGCLVFMLLNSSLLLNPMTDMIKKMNFIREGHRDEKFVLKGKNDFAQMAETFNQMLSESVMSEELHRTISDISDNMLFEWDFSKQSLYISDNLREKFDIDIARAGGLKNGFIEKLMDKPSFDRYSADIDNFMKNRINLQGEYQAYTKNGNLIWISIRAQCISDRFGEPLRALGVITDIDNEKKLTLQLVERASYDFLSQLYNRSTFERELQTELERHANSRVAILFIDVDDFKLINDRYGHSVGDEVIRYVSDKIHFLIDGGGFAGRFGGDEFVLCITDLSLITKVDVLAIDLIEELASGYYSESADVKLKIKASIGISLSPEHGNTGKVLIAAADEAMYYVKKNGKSNYHIYSPADMPQDDIQHTI